MNAPRCKPVVLVVLDGWGYSEHLEHNAILNARTPIWDHLWRDYPHLLIRCSGTDVGLPADKWATPRSGISTWAPAAWCIRNSRASVARSRVGRSSPITPSPTRSMPR